MIKYNSVSNELEYETKIIPQNCGVYIVDIDVEKTQEKCKYFLEIKCPKDRRFISKEIDFNDNMGTVELSGQISSEVGNIYVQLVKRSLEGEILGKSIMSKEPLFRVTESINAIDKQDYSRMNDCIESIINKSNELSKLHDEILKKVEKGEFNGKDGTLIKVNGVIEKNIEFTDNPQLQLDNKIGGDGGCFNSNALLTWETCNDISSIMGYSKNKDTFIIASLNSGISDNLTISPKTKKICWRDKELVTSDYWKPTNMEIDNIFGTKQTDTITEWTAPADGYIYVSINFGDNNRHYASIFARDFIRAERCVASQISTFGWQVMTLKVYKNLVYSLDLPEYNTVLNVISKFTYATGSIDNNQIE